MTAKHKQIITPGEEDVARYAPSGSPANHVDVGASGDQTPREGQPAEAEQQTPAVHSNETVELLRQELALCRDKLLRAQAECANVAKRLNQQHAESLKFAGMDLARALLPVMDNMQRTLENLREAHAGDPVIQGVKLVAEQLGKVLQDHGVAAIQAVGSPFDPACHEALMEDRQSDLPAGTVTMEMQRGYKMHDRVLRPARVAVAAAKNGKDEQGASPTDKEKEEEEGAGGEDRDRQEAR